MGFVEAYNKTSIFEGGYSDNPNDLGGPTNYGITEEVARANGYNGDMKDLPKNIAVSIAKRQYWDTLQGDQIDALSSDIMEELYDTGLNCGIGIAGRFLQRCLNAFNRQQKDYRDLVVDGVIGPLTVAMLRKYVVIRGKEGVTVMLRALNSLQGERYISISESRKENEEFTYGWFRNRISI